MSDGVCSSVYSSVKPFSYPFDRALASALPAEGAGPERVRNSGPERERERKREKLYGKEQLRFDSQASEPADAHQCEPLAILLNAQATPFMQQILCRKPSSQDIFHACIQNSLSMRHLQRTLSEIVPEELPFFSGVVVRWSCHIDAHAFICRSIRASCDRMALRLVAQGPCQWSQCHSPMP